jgi:type IV pilus assembly protein PilC
MPNYDYTARDGVGNTLTGVLQASGRSELRRLLRETGLYLTESKVTFVPSGIGGSGGLNGLFKPKPTLQELVIATRQLAVAIRSGLPILDALVIVGSQAAKPALKDAFADIQQGVTDGQTLSLGMRRHPALFTPLVVALVEAGERSGTLDAALDLASTQLDREDVFRKRVKTASVYPKLVAAACGGTIATMLVFVIPVFSNVYKGLHAPMPAPTLLLIALSEAVMRWWWLMAAVVGALLVPIRRYLQTEEGRLRRDGLALKTPMLGTVLQKVAVARFVQTLSGTLRAGVPVLNALSISAGTAGNAVIQDAVEAAVHGVREGASIATELEKTGHFPLLATRMIAAGESTGTTDSMLEEISRFYERDIDDAMDKLTRSLEPLMTMLMGGIVLLVLLALYVPIFSLGNAFLHRK